MLHLTPFLLFQGNCAEAMAFYHACLGGELVLTRLGDTPMKASFPEEQHGAVTYAHLKNSLVEFSATDWLHPTRIPTQGNTVGMFVSGNEIGDLRSTFIRLSEGASQDFFVDLCKMPFGWYGRFTDRFGVEWFFQGASDSDSSLS